MANEADSVTHWLDQVKAGDERAAGQLWERYFQTLVGLAQIRLRSAPRAAEDEEDVALSAFDSFLVGAARGRFPRLDDRHDLWRLLVTITNRKAIDQIQRQRRRKRGGGRAVGVRVGLEEIFCLEPTPEIAAMVADECRARLAALRDETLRRVALLKMEGATNAEIAEQLGCGLRTVVRKLELIRKAWTTEVTA